MNAGASAPSSAAPAPTARKPRFALFVATACGLGHLPLAPGTWGSLGGVLLTLAPFWGLFSIIFVSLSLEGTRVPRPWWVSVPASPFDPILWGQLALAIIVAAMGVWSANRSAKFLALKDPQRVVIDEVSGQQLTLLLGCGIPVAHTVVASVYNWQFRTVGFGLVTARTALSWKYVLLGFILFRVFDIWKPFPVRQAESLPGGWGIMADDWVAAIYAALGLWVARAVGL
jgi:phosphatidylglycerophosphatase A